MGFVNQVDLWVAAFWRPVQHWIPVGTGIVPMAVAAPQSSCLSGLIDVAGGPVFVSPPDPFSLSPDTVTALRRRFRALACGSVEGFRFYNHHPLLVLGDCPAPLAPP